MGSFVSGADVMLGKVEQSRFAIHFDPSESQTVQSAKEDADINVIVKRFGLTGQIKAPNVEPFYGDFSGVDDYMSAQNMLVEAKAAFMELPAAVRDRFANDPAQLIEFVHNDANLEEARKLGLLKPKEAPPEPQMVRIVPDKPPEGVKPPEGGAKP